MLENLISVISVLRDIHAFLSAQSLVFGPSTHCVNTPLSYIVQNMCTNIQAKAFVDTRMGGTIYYKTFPNFYMLHC